MVRVATLYCEVKQEGGERKNVELRGNKRKMFNF